MKEIIRQIIDFIGMVLPFLRKKDTKKLKEFSELVTGQYQFLMSEVEKVLKDYFELSAKVKEMHQEVLSLKEQLSKALALQCRTKDCGQRNAEGV